MEHMSFFDAITCRIAAASRFTIYDHVENQRVTDFARIMEIFNFASQ